MTKKEKQESLDKMFPIISLCRADLVMEGYDKKKVLKIEDSIMKYIASQITDQIMEDFWIVLNDRLEDMGYKKKVGNQ